MMPENGKEWDVWEGEGQILFSSLSSLSIDVLNRIRMLKQDGEGKEDFYKMISVEIWY